MFNIGSYISSGMQQAGKIVIELLVTAGIPDIIVNDSTFVHKLVTFERFL